MKKIGLLALALIMALGALGIGYAAWTDTINITGTVETGSVSLDIVDCSNTWVYKVMGNTQYPNEIAIIHDWDLFPAPKPTGTYVELVASADAKDTSSTVKEITVTFDNAFPLDGEESMFCADALLQYNGTIPVIVDATFTGFTGDPADLALLAQVSRVKFFHAGYDPLTGEWKQGDEITGPVQLHQGAYVYCVMCLEIPEDAAYMNLSGGFTAVITAIQWNEYVD